MARASEPAWHNVRIYVVEYLHFDGDGEPVCHYAAYRNHERARDQAEIWRHQARADPDLGDSIRSRVSVTCYTTREPVSPTIEDEE
jgi:hypothetical protein